MPRLSDGPTAGVRTAWGSAVLISWNAQHDTGNAVVDGLSVIRWEGDIYDTNESVILIRHGCTGNLSNFTFSNIHVERTGRNSRLVGWSIGPTSWSCDVPGCACGANADELTLISFAWSSQFAEAVEFDREAGWVALAHAGKCE